MDKINVRVTLWYRFRAHAWRIKGAFVFWNPVMRLFKIKNNKVVFENMTGMGYGGDPKYIAEYILDKNLDFDLVWLYDRRCVKRGVNLPDKVRFVDMYSLRGLYEQATAHFWVSNARKYVYSPKKKEQFYIHTWHGTFPVKYIEKDAENNIGKVYLRVAKKDSTMIDCITSGCRYATQIYQKSFYYDGEVLEIGTPKEDIFFNPISIETNKKKVKQAYSIKEKKIILYAPTFRSGGKLDAYDLDYERIQNAFQTVLQEDCAFLVRLHPNVAALADKLNLPENVINATMYPDMQELLCAADYVISDYSSIMDYSLFDKPIFLYCSDLERYLSTERDMYVKMDELPFSVARTNDELEQNILNFDRQAYLERLHNVYEKYGLCENGTASEKIVSMMCEKMKS